MTDEELAAELRETGRAYGMHAQPNVWMMLASRARALLAAERPEMSREAVDDSAIIAFLRRLGRAPSEIDSAQVMDIRAAISHFAPPREARPIDGMTIIRDGLSVLSDEVRATWRAEDYPVNVQSDAAQFRHAAIHAMKALGKISALIDHADHERLDTTEAEELRGELPKLLADLLRCSAKMAEKAPGGSVSLAGSYVSRATQLAERWGHRLAQPVPKVDPNIEAEAMKWANLSADLHNRGANTLSQTVPRWDQMKEEARNEFRRAVAAAKGDGA